MQNSSIFEALFLVFLFGNLALSVYLYFRQLRSISVHRGKIPHEFSQSVSLKQYERESENILRRDRMQETRHVVFLFLVFMASIGGALQWFADWGAASLGNGMPAQLFMVLVPALVFTASGFVLSTHQAGIGLFNVLWWSVVGIVLAAITLILWSSDVNAWWFWAWLATSAILAAAYWIQSVIYPPVRPVSDGELRNRLNEFLRRAGFECRGVFVSDVANLNSENGVRIVGIGRNKRVILGKEVLQKLTPLEIEAVLAIEIGRERYASGSKMFLFYLFGSFLFFAALNYFTQQSWFFTGLGISQAAGTNHGIASVLFVMAAYVFLFPLVPLINAGMWNLERAAERYSVKLVHWNSMINAIVAIAADKAGAVISDPLYSVFYHSHPDAMQRIRDIQKMAPRHTRQRDSWLPNA